MLFLENIFDKYRSHFGATGRFRALYPLFYTIENIILAPSQSTSKRPFIRDAIEIKRYMSMVILSLAPAVIASVFLFGLRVLAIIAVSYVFGGLVEVLFAIFRKEEINEGFLVTGLIFPLILPPTIPLWLVAVGIIAGVLFGKEMFGGTGRNIFNPALVGRLFITISFPAIMTTRWQIPMADAITAATPLSQFKSTGVMSSYLDLFMGTIAGSAGETCALAIIIGGLFLIFTKVANWRIPLVYLATVALLAGIGHQIWPSQVAPPLFQLLAGGLLFGAMFMATDPVTSPVTKTGKYIFGIGCGILTVLIRSFSGYVEGVMFSIVLMNAFSPLIDHIVLLVKYPDVKVNTL